ncbi:MAG TPA: FtsX-like permease family protein [Vicinamibacterales bacterium]
MREPFLALLGAVSCVLLIACANVGNLQLERVLGRRHELGLRRALGASRGRVIRQTLTENFVLAVLGAGAGLAAAWWTLPLVVRLIPPYVPHVSDITLRPEVFVAAAAVVLTTMMIVGLIPAIRAASASLMEDLRTGPRSQASAGQWPRRALVVGEVALATTLLVGAALTVQTFLTLRPSDPGFNPAHKIIGGVRRNGPFVADGKNRVFFTRMLQRVRAVPGIQAVSATDYLPMSGMVGTAKADAGEVQKTVWLSRMTSNYLHEMAIPILAGRSFQASDDEHAPAVAIVNERAARALWADGSPIGMSLTLELFDGKRIETQVIGIARNTRSLGVTLDVHNEVYLPYAQDSTPMLHVIATVAGAAPPDLLHAFREAATAEDSGVVIDRIVSFQDIVDGSVSAERFGAWLFGAFGVIAVALAGLGLAAVVTWWVTQRTREIGVRIALGAPRGAVARLILGQSVGLAAAGIALGVVISLLSTRLLRGWLYGVTPLDARTFVLGSAAMLVIAALASYLPARRAAGVDPIVTLRAE